MFISACSSAQNHSMPAPAVDAAPGVPAASAPQRQLYMPAGDMALNVATEADIFVTSDDMEFWSYGSMEVSEEEAFDIDFLADGGVARFSTSQLERMIVRNASLSLQTIEFARATAEIDRLIMIYGGFVEDSQQWLVTRRDGESFWNAHYTLRVPVEYFDIVNRDLMALGEVVAFSTFSEDVTMRFSDMESRLRIRQEEERRLLAMIDSTEDLGELIRLETRLANLLITIDSIQRSMTELDHLASFATIHLHLEEVDEDDGKIVPYIDSFSDRIVAAFGGSIEFSVLLLEGFAIFLAAVILPITVIGLIIFGVFLLVRRAIRSRA